MSLPDESLLLGQIIADTASSTNERVMLSTNYEKRQRILRNQFVTITDALDPSTIFLGRLLSGPFFPESGKSATQHTGAIDARAEIRAQVEIQGELVGNRSHDTNNRPSPGSVVYELGAKEVRAMLRLEGDMLLGCLSGRGDLRVELQSRSKDVLPRNVGIFGTVGSGKSNSVQVLVEEASECGWAVVLLDLEAEYVDMDQPTTQEHLVRELTRFGKQPRGLSDLHVYYPVSCPSDRVGSQPFTLRMADFDSSVTAELLQATLAERNALLDCIDHFQQKFYSAVRTNDADRQNELLDPSPQARLPYTLQLLRSRAVERSPRNSESLDYIGLQSKLQLLIHSGAFDQSNMKGMDPGEMLRPGRVNVIDVSAANDTVKNLVTADLLRKTFAYKITRPEAPPTMLVIEEAHSFMSRERVQTMQSTLQMLRNVTRRGRKRWLSLTFVSQQPGHLPPEIFELCNTRLVHTLRSMHNLDTMMATTGDITSELWSRCPLLGTGEAIISTPQLHRSVVVTIRPAASSRRFVR
jgi:DNA helicase HerA-like ATPase